MTRHRQVVIACLTYCKEPTLPIQQSRLSVHAVGGLLMRIYLPAVAGLILGLTTPVDAVPLSYSNTVQCTGFYSSGSETFPCDRINDNIVTDGPGAVDLWSFWLGRQATGLETLTVDLGGLFTLSQVDLYNTHNRNHNDRGTLDFRMWISSAPVTPTTNVGDTFGTLILDGTLAFTAGQNPNAAQIFSSFLATPTGRYVTFRADSFFSQGAGLSELDLSGDPARLGGVPEPAGMILLGTGLGCLALLRRYRRT
jgi:hypothetical protein